jgi:hypothetical protein
MIRGAAIIAGAPVIARSGTIAGGVIFAGDHMAVTAIAAFTAIIGLALTIAFGVVPTLPTKGTLTAFGLRQSMTLFTNPPSFDRNPGQVAWSFSSSKQKPALERFSPQIPQAQKQSSAGARCRDKSTQQLLRCSVPADDMLPKPALMRR